MENNDLAVDSKKIDNVLPTPLIEEKKPAYENTIYKASYWYGGRLIQLFVNFNVGGHGTFSHIIKKDGYTLIHNLTNKDENLSYAKAIISKLSPEELKIVLDSLKKE